MNIFYLDTNPELAAQYQCDKHVVKMILESAQLLSTAHRVLDGQESRELSPGGRNLKVWKHPNKNMDELLYKASHVNHPCAIWCRTSIPNYTWLYLHFVALCNEYTFRYNKLHLSDTKLKNVLKTYPNNLKSNVWTEPHQAMPDEYKNVNSVVAYRNYYIFDKSEIAVWNNGRLPPDWYLQGK